MLCHNVHRNLAKIQVFADPCGRGDSGRAQYIQNDPLGERPGSAPIRFQIGGGVNEYFVNGIDMDILGRDVFQIYIVNPRAVHHIMLHAGRRNDIVER